MKFKHLRAQRMTVSRSYFVTMPIAKKIGSV